jgi:hypothetical protein
MNSIVTNDRNKWTGETGNDWCYHRYEIAAVADAASAIIADFWDGAEDDEQDPVLVAYSVWLQLGEVLRDAGWKPDELIQELTRHLRQATEIGFGNGIGEMEMTYPTRRDVDSALTTTTEYLDKAIERIDERFGEGYAKAHPELVAAFMYTSVADYGSTLIAETFTELSEAIQFTGDAYQNARDQQKDRVAAALNNFVRKHTTTAA